MCCLILAAVPAAGQTNGDTKTRIVANPAGSMVYLDGEYSVAGRAPYSIGYRLKGAYRIKATKRGYESYSATHRLTPDVSQRIAINLTRKTRARALLRSIFIPGWGQRYTDQLAKGTLLTAFSASSLIYLVHTDVQYQRAVDDFEAALAGFQNSENSIEERQALLAELGRTESTLNDRYERRRTALIIAGSIYVYNLLDALIFFPTFTDDEGFSVQADAARQSVQIGYRVKL